MNQSELKRKTKKQQQQQQTKRAYMYPATSAAKYMWLFLGTIDFGFASHWERMWQEFC